MNSFSRLPLVEERSGQDQIYLVWQKTIDVYVQSVSPCYITSWISGYETYYYLWQTHCQRRGGNTYISFRYFVNIALRSDSETLPCVPTKQSKSLPQTELRASNWRDGLVDSSRHNAQERKHGSPLNPNNSKTGMGWGAGLQSRVIAFLFWHSPHDHDKGRVHSQHL